MSFTIILSPGLNRLSVELVGVVLMTLGNGLAFKVFNCIIRIGVQHHGLIFGIIDPLSNLYHALPVNLTLAI